MADQNATETKGMKPIWYFVGILLMIIGVIVCVTGLVGLVSPPPEDQKTVLYDLHVGTWWGAIITMTGLVFLWTNRNVTVQ